MDKPTKDEILKVLKWLHHVELQEVIQFWKDRGLVYDSYDLGDMTPEENGIWEDGFLAGIRRSIDAVEQSENEVIH